MKEFNLEEAKAGKAVCTRGGKDIRILCYDNTGDYPIVSIYGDGGVLTHTINGRHNLRAHDSSYDLVMKSEKRTGWINIYKNGYINRAHDTKEKADAIAGLGRIDCIKIEWEE